MNLSRAAGASPWSRRLRIVVLAAIVCAGLIVVAAAGFHHTLNYYRTPSEVITHPPQAGQEFRLGGLVKKGSVTRHGVAVSFVMTDGADDLTVVSTSSPPSAFRGGRGAVVDGWLTTNGIFHASQVMVRHSNVYEPPKSQ
jgi:cytochrome c-type biogenesis protein CcmE